jgi:hypothetical protein
VKDIDRPTTAGLELEVTAPGESHNAQKKMKSLANEKDRQVILDRLRRLNPDSKAAWGHFTAHEMICHVADHLRMSYGEVQTKPPAGRAFTRFPLKHLLLFLLPIPKNLPTDAGLLSTKPTTFEQDRETCAELIWRFADSPAVGKGPSHPFFGILTWRQWGVLQWRHADHHLRQFNAR